MFDSRIRRIAEKTFIENLKRKFTVAVVFLDSILLVSHVERSYLPISILTNTDRV